MAESCLLYYITDRTAFAPDEPTRRRRLLEKISEAARAGIVFIQLREKDLSTRELESLARNAVKILDQLRTENSELRTALLINSRTDAALAVGADGVHLRSNDVSPQEVKRIWQRSTDSRIPDSCTAGAPARVSPRNPLIAVSCHSPAEVKQAAAQGAGFAVLAPVFEKKDAPGVQPTGLEALREAASTIQIPVLALGGITLANAHQSLAAGAAGIAAIRLFQENNIEEVVRALRIRTR